MREREGSFIAPRLQLETGLPNCSIKIISRTLKRNGFSYIQTRRKGLMTPSDLKCRVKFANLIKKNYDKDIQKKDICFSLDGKSFVHKLNPRDQARAPKARKWRTKMKDWQQTVWQKAILVEVKLSYCFNKNFSRRKPFKLSLTIGHQVNRSKMPGFQFTFSWDFSKTFFIFITLYEIYLVWWGKVSVEKQWITEPIYI